MTISTSACYFLLIRLALASPLALPQAVTEAISPPAPAPPSCSGSYEGTFGIAAFNLTIPTPVKRQADEYIKTTSITVAPISQIADGQIQAPTAVTVTTVICASRTAHSTMMPIVQIADGQIQNPVVPKATQSTLPGNNVQTASSQSTHSPNSITINLSQPSHSTTMQSLPISTTTPASSSPSRLALVSCRTNSTLTLNLSNSILTDAQNRTGYIASNTQFQFDGPPQSGAMFTAGWSVCADGSLALGGSAVFFQCLSGDFYNLYTENWAPQCHAVRIAVVEIVDC